MKQSDILLRHSIMDYTLELSFFLTLLVVVGYILIRS